MKGEASVGRSHGKNDHRSTHFYVANMKLRADSDAEAYILAAVYRALFGNKNEANELRQAIKDEAVKCCGDRLKQEKKNAR